MWQVSRTRLQPQTEHWSLRGPAGEAVSFGQVFALWRESEDFRAFWTRSLRTVPFNAYCWECPPVTVQDLHRPFQCVFIESPLLGDCSPNPAPFRDHFRTDQPAVSFESLGKDALLIAPCPADPDSDFAHLA